MLFDPETVNRLIAAEHRREMEKTKPEDDEEKAMRDVCRHAIALARDGGMTAAEEKRFEKLRSSATLDVSRDQYGHLQVSAVFGTSRADLIAFALLYWFHEEAHEKDQILRPCVYCGSPFYSTGGRLKCAPANKRCYNWSAQWVHEDDDGQGTPF